VKKQKKYLGTIAVDIDGVLTNTRKGFTWQKSTPEQIEKFYKGVKPNPCVITTVNKYYSMGYIIKIFTSRDEWFRGITEKWLKKNKVKYNALHMNKLYYDFIIDDKALML